MIEDRYGTKSARLISLRRCKSPVGKADGMLAKRTRGIKYALLYRLFVALERGCAVLEADEFDDLRQDGVFANPDRLA
ncbi:MAG: hypothetical protein IPL73_19860 [Candidatus Obscuribacter sp.]|nr:hypothetical protein [Candidatus Obscuribacter sp.]